MTFKTIPAAAELLGVSATVVRRAAQAGRIQSMPLGNRLLVDMDAATAYFAAITRGASIEEVSADTGLAVTAIRRAILDGWMPCTKPGKAYVFDLSAVREAVKKRMEEHMANGQR